MYASNKPLFFYGPFLVWMYYTYVSYLLPDKSRSSKRKTSVIKNSANPVWDEEKVYEKVSLEKLARDRVLEVTVWDFNRGSSNDFIGGLRLGSQPISSLKKHDFMDSMGTEVSPSVHVPGA